MDSEHSSDIDIKKIVRATEREVNSAVLLLRAVQLGVSIADLDLLNTGQLLDICTEASNDQYDYAVLATQSDIDSL